jgi:uncharacterized protein YlzI (FlbEa/FlbD family)
MTWFPVTDLAGRRIWRNADCCERVRPNNGDADRRAPTVIDLQSGKSQAVAESVDELIALVRRP